MTSLNRPGGNVTGIVFTTGDLTAKRLGLLRDLVPNASVIGVLVDPRAAGAEQLREGVEQGRRALGLRIEMAQSSNAQEFEAAFATMVRASAGGLLVGGGPFFFGQRQQIVALAARHALPASYATRNYTEAGGLMSYGPSQSDAYRQAGVYTGRILRGAKPADLPVEQATKFELVINLKTAKALGLTVPTSMQLLADEVIESADVAYCAGFRTPAWDAIHALRRPASEKRQGRKSREVGHWRCRGCYGDLAAGFGLMRLDRIGCRDRFSAKPV